MAVILDLNRNVLEETNCPLCGESGAKSFISYVHREYVKCSSCGLCYLNPRIKEAGTADYYSDEENYVGRDDETGYETQEKALRATFRKFLKHLKKKGLAGGRLLAIGCGEGFLLDEARHYFYYRVGTEYSEESAANARRFADAVYCGDLEDMPENINNFDVIINFAVIEHVYDPREFLDSLNSRLADGGVIISATPNAGDFWYDALGEKWPFFITPAHACLYNRNTLAKLFLERGFRDIRIFEAPHTWPLSTFLKKLGSMAVGDLLSHIFLGKIPITVPKSILCVSARK